MKQRDPEEVAIRDERTAAAVGVPGEGTSESTQLQDEKLGRKITRSSISGHPLASLRADAADSL